MEVCCKRCGSARSVKNGLMRGKQRYLCKECGLAFTDTPARGKPLAMKAAAVLPGTEPDDRHLRQPWRPRLESWPVVVVGAHVAKQISCHGRRILRARHGRRARRQAQDGETRRDDKQPDEYPTTGRYRCRLVASALAIQFRLRGPGLVVHGSCRHAGAFSHSYFLRSHLL